MDRRWWGWERSATSIVAFRLVVGVVVAAYFGLHLLRSVPLLETSGLFDPTLAPGTAHASVLGRGLSAWSLRGLFALAVVLSLLATTTRVARACASCLLLICAATYWALLPAAFIDDSAACWGCFALMALPAPRVRSVRELVQNPSVPGLGATWLLVLALVFYASGVLGPVCGARPNALAAIALAGRAVAVGLLAPSARLRALAVVAQFGLHAYLACVTPTPILNGILAATGVLFWGETARAGATRPVPLDAGSLAVAMVSLVLAFDLAGVALAGVPGVQAFSEPSRRLLSDSGLVPPNPVPPASPIKGALILDFTDAADGTKLSSVDLDISSVRVKILATQLALRGFAPYRNAIVARLALRYCRALGANDPAGRRVRLSVGEDGIPLLEFACAGPELAYVDPPSYGHGHS